MEKVKIGVIENIYNVYRTMKNEYLIECAVGGHTISITNFEFYERMSEETNCFVGDLVLDGNIVGECRNEGRGGCSSYYAPKNWELAKEIESILAQTENYCFPKSKLNLYDVIDSLADLMIMFQINNVKTLTMAIRVIKHIQESADKYRAKYSV